MRAQVKSKVEIAKEKAERMRSIRVAAKEVKETGEKVKFQKFGRWAGTKKYRPVRPNYQD